MLPDKEIRYHCPHSYSVILDVTVFPLLGTPLLIWLGFHVPAIPPQLMSPAALPALLHYFLVFSFVLSSLFSNTIWLISFFCFKYISGLPVPLESGPNCLHAKGMPLLYCPHLQSLLRAQDSLMPFPEPPTFVLHTGPMSAFSVDFFYEMEMGSNRFCDKTRKSNLSNSLDSRTWNTR